MMLCQLFFSGDQAVSALETLIELCAFSLQKSNEIAFMVSIVQRINLCLAHKDRNLSSDFCTCMDARSIQFIEKRALKSTVNRVGD